MSADTISPLFGSPFGALLRRYRESAGLTQEELAQRAGLSVRGISDLERGLRQNPRRDTVEMLADALGSAPHQRALLEAAARPTSQGQRWQAPPAAPNNLPARLTNLLGREREARVLAEYLARADVRLLTLTGPGGVGKTRLALEVAEEALDRFEDGVYLISLAPLREPAHVLSELANVLGLRLGNGSPESEIVTALRDRRTLLIFDNVEHLLSAAPRVADLLGACPQVKVLVTSREPLKLSGEREFTVEPLSSAAAARLFVERAQATQPTFAPSEADRPVIDAICARVDGLALGVELAAGWVRVLPLQTLLERLDKRLDLLSAGRRDAPERQRTLRGAIAWSVDFLDPAERQLFQRLAIFAGGCTLEAAEAICAEDDAERAATLDGLARLVEKSLLRAEITPDGVRFLMLETIRDVAREELDVSDAAEGVARRHAAYFAQAIAQLGWFGADLDARDRRLERETPNARAALAWTLAHDEPGMGLRLATPLGRWWYSRGAFDEGERWLQALLDLDASGGAKSAPPQLRCAALFALIIISLDRRQYAAAERLAQEGLALARRQGDRAQMGNMLSELGHVAEARGDLDAARTYFEEALTLQRQQPDGAATGRTLSSLGNIARVQGDYRQARIYLEQSLAWVRERAFSFAVASGLFSLGHLDCEEGDFASALTHYAEALHLAQTMALRNPTSLAWGLEGVAIALAASQQYTSVGRICGAIAALRAVAGAADQAEWPLYTQATATARAALGEQPFAEAYDAGRALTPEQAIALALELSEAKGGA